jgi:hypothetical protein
VIGDAAPNTVEEVDEKRAERDWNCTKFARKTNYQVEIAKCK